MKFLFRSWTFTVLVLGFIFPVHSQDQPQDPKKSNFDKYEAFSPLFMEGQTNAFHSATGEPGPEYWQNTANYKIKATLDTINHKVTGQMTLTYINNSPYKMDFLWLQLDQNTFTKESRGSALYPANDRNGIRTHTDGYELQNVSIDMDHGMSKADYVVSDTRMQIRLPEALDNKGAEMKIHINYSFTIPEHGKDRMGRVKTKNGWIYTLAQWYPRMCVYDEVEGWNTLPYLGTGEFYLEYGDFDFEITAPANMVVVGSGLLQNPKEVLTSNEMDQLEKAGNSNKTVFVRTQEEMMKGEHHKGDGNGMLTWHFTMQQSRDIAWAASKAFIWDAARINLPEGKTALAQSVYPVENSGQDGYGRSTEYVKNSIELYSQEWFPYTYPVATNVGAHEGGMEYPGIVFCDYKSMNDKLWGVVNHEFGHNWFPMIVGSNERKYAWMDEGFNTFINDVDTKVFNNGEYFNQQNYQSMGERLFDENLDPIFTTPDVIHNQRNLGAEAYYKPSTGLHVLRNVILGKDRFDYAFRTYIKRWAFKHPQPWDFFNTMNNAAGEDLGWFFKGWFIKNWTIDQAVESIDYVNGNPSEGVQITLLNKGEIPMPVNLKIVLKNGESKMVKLPVEIWMTGPEYVYLYPSTSEVASVEIDPERLVPDTNLLNNEMDKLAPVPSDQTSATVIEKYIQAIGGRKNLEGLKTLSVKMKTQIQGTLVNINIMQKEPDKFLQEITVGGQPLLKTTVNGDDITVLNRGKTQELTPDQKEAIKEEGDNMFPELRYLKAPYKTELLGVDDKNGANLYVVEITGPDGNSSKTYYDAKTGYKVKEVGRTITTYSDYRAVNEIKFPFKRTTTMFGAESDINVESIQVNSKLDDSNFK